MSERPDRAPGGAPDDLAPGASWADFRAARERFLRRLRRAVENPEAGVDEPAADEPPPPGQALG